MIVNFITNTVPNYLRSLQRRDNLIFLNIPEEKNETKSSLKTAIIKVAKACDFDLHYTEICSAVRLRKSNQNWSFRGLFSRIFLSLFPQQSNSSSPVLVEFIDSNVKDSLFREYLRNISRNTPVTTAIFSGVDIKRIYINHHLSSDMVKIKQKAVELKKKGYLEKINASYNEIKVQRGNTWHTIEAVEQLEQLIR